MRLEKNIFFQNQSHDSAKRVQNLQHFELIFLKMAFPIFYVIFLTATFHIFKSQETFVIAGKYKIKIVK